MISIESMQIFLAVVRRGSFSSVARDSGASPSSITRSIDQLEHWLGVRLFQRSTRTLSLTEAGQLFFDRIQPLIEELERARGEIKDLSTSIAGQIRITASPSFGTVCLAPILAKIKSLYPELNIDLVQTDRVVDLMEENFDLAIRHGPLPDSNLIAERLMSTRYRVCASPSYIAQHGQPNEPEDLIKHRSLVFSLPVFRSHWKFRKNGGDIFKAPLTPVMQVNNGMVLRQWALDGLGIVMLSDWLIKNNLNDGSLVDLFPDYESTATEFDTKLWLIYPSKNYVPNKVRVVAGHLKDWLSKGQ